MAHRNHNRSLLTLLYLFTLVTLALPIFASPDYKVLHSFGKASYHRDPINPSSNLILGIDGNFYGTTETGGSYFSSYGTVYKITTTGNLTILHSFKGDYTILYDGYCPEGKLVQDKDGNLYGTTQYGGSSINSDPYNKGYGIIYKITASGTYTILHSFGDGTVTNDGKCPMAGLTLGPDGNFYGTTSGGGAGGRGTVYKMTPSGNITILHSFCDGTILNDGIFPWTNLILGPDSCLYGTTCFGGALNFSGLGTAFKITTSGDCTILHSFTLDIDGEYPGPLLLGMDGSIYGTTRFGSNWSDFGGLLYKMSPTGSITLLHSFDDGSVEYDGMEPSGDLVQDAYGNIYGTTRSGGTTYNLIQYNGFGTIFKYTQSGQYSVIHSFSDGSTINDGQCPESGLVKDNNGNIYGLTYTGSVSLGTFYKIDNANSVSIIYQFCLGSIGDNGSTPHASLIQGSDGYLYGTTMYGGQRDFGTVYKMATTGELSVIHSFYAWGYGGEPYMDDGTCPDTNLVEGVDGYYYGTTGGNIIGGKIFKISSLGKYSILYSTDNTSLGSIIQGFDKCLYVDLNYLYSISPLGTMAIVSPILHLNVAGIIQASDGSFYGTTTDGGTAGYGSIFKITNLGTITTLHSFGDGSLLNDGHYPHAPLVQASDGNFYGTTFEGGSVDVGTIFKMTPSGDVTILHSFMDGGVVNEGSNPEAGLIQCSDGDLYGTTKNGIYHGLFYYNYGNIYKITLSGKLSNIHTLNDDVYEGKYPISNLLQASDGNLYGTASEGGSNDKGTVFRIITLSTDASISSTLLYNGWYNGPATATLTVSDNKGPSDIAATYYTIDGGSTQTYSSPFNISSDGSHIITYWSVGASGNIEPLNSKTFKIDAVAPITTCTINGTAITLSATDIESGVKSTYYTIDSGAQQAYTSTFNVLNNGTHTINYWSIDNVGNIETAGAQTFTISIPPTITRLSPSSVPGAQTVTLTINGTNFESGSIVKFNGTNMTTTYVSPTQLTASINKYYTTMASYPGSATVLVVNPDGKRTSSATVTITKPNPIPTITSLSPSTVSGAKSFTLTVNGTNFVSGSVIKWNGTNMTTTYVSATQLTASINKYYTTLSSYPGSATISVLNPDGNRSTNATLTITAPLPSISSLSPASVQGATTFTLTVNGSNFVSGSIIKWNGTNMTTTFVSSNQLTASINKYYDTLASYPGSATISILNPDGGRSAGTAIAITQPITPPTIISLSPSSVTGATNFTLTVNGTGFQSGAVIKWNGTNITTSFVSSTQLTAVINKYYTTLASYPGSATVSVLNPDSGRSAGATLAISQP